MWFFSTLLSMVLHCGERLWKSRNGDSDVGGVGGRGRDRTEAVHHGQTSHGTEENMPVGAGEFSSGGLSYLQCQVY